MSAADQIQAALIAGYAAAGQVLGQPFQLYRSTASNPLQTTPITTLPAQFTNAKASGFNFDKSRTYEDVLFAALIDGSQIEPGDYLTGDQTYFIAAMPPLLPIMAAMCNATVTVERPGAEITTTGGAGQGMPSQPGGSGTYFGASRQPITTALGAGLETIKSGIPCAMIGTTGRATGTGELPSDAPGPSRWRIYMPPSAFPDGSIQIRDQVVDQNGTRFQVSAPAWTALGYRLEAVMLSS